MVLSAIIAGPRFRNFTRNKSCQLQSYRSDLHGYGRSVRDAKDLCIRYIVSFCMTGIDAKSVLGCFVYKQRLPNILHEKEGTEGCRRC